MSFDEKLRNALKSLLWKAGIDIKLHRNSATFELNLMSLIIKNKIDLIIDVGANTGQFGELLKKIGYSNKLYSFEPNPYAFKILSEKASSVANWSCHPIALGEKTEEMELNLHESSVFSSFQDINETGLKLWPSLKNSKRISVNVVRADQFFKKEDLKNSNILLKMDTQGFDNKVFVGANDIMQNVHVLLSELSFKPIYENMMIWSDSIKLYESEGFYLSGLYPVSRTDGWRLIEADGLFCRDTSN